MHGHCICYFGHLCSYICKPCIIEESVSICSLPLSSTAVVKLETSVHCSVTI